MMQKNEDYLDYQRPDSSENLPTVVQRVQSTAEDALHAVINRPIVTLAVAGTLGFAIGALIYKSRQTPQSSLQRAIELARSGTVTTVGNVRERLRREGYSTAKLQGQAKRYIRDVIAATRDSIS